MTKLEHLRAQAMAILSDLIDPEPCKYDRHGYCQSHALHNRPCPHERAKQILREELKRQNPSPMPCEAFPRNPGRDENGNPVLYPGRVRYEGLAALFTTDDSGEFVVMAPDLKSLNSVVIRHGIRNNGGPMVSEQCVHSRLDIIDNTGVSGAHGGSAE